MQSSKLCSPAISFRAWLLWYLGEASWTGGSRKRGRTGAGRGLFVSWSQYGWRQRGETIGVTFAQLPLCFHQKDLLLDARRGLLLLSS